MNDQNRNIDFVSLWKPVGGQAVFGNRLQILTVLPDVDLGRESLIQLGGLDDQARAPRIPGKRIIAVAA